jgi:hypothetical protein
MRLLCGCRSEDPDDKVISVASNDPGTEESG